VIRWAGGLATGTYGITPAAALAALREMLAGIGVVGASEYRCHDLRRGHALDLQLSGAPLWEILAAGEWRSPAFLSYLDLHSLETELVIQVALSTGLSGPRVCGVSALQAHCDESDGDEHV